MNKLTAEQVRKAIFNGSGYASYDGAKYYADGINMQAIADELNTRADDYKQAAEYWQRMYEQSFTERTCQIVGFDDGVDEGIDGEWHRYDDPKWDLSCGHSVYGVERPNYCPNCGARVIKSDQYL